MTPSAIGRWGWNFPKIERGPRLEKIVRTLDEPWARVGDRER
jgi:hypothetical protein